MRKSRIKAHHIFLLIALSLAFVRLFYSIDLSDEVSWIAEIYNASTGKRPIIDIWDPHTGWFLYVPFMMLFSALVPDLEGIILFFRILYFVLALLCLGISFKILTKHNEDKDLIMLSTFGCITYVCFSIPSVGYNTSISYLFILAFALLERWNTSWSAFFGGCIIGLTCLLFPPMAILAVLSLLLLVGDQRSIRYIFFYCLGIFIIAAIFFFWLLKGGTVGDISFGLKAILSSPHEQSKGKINAIFLKITFLDRLRAFFSFRRSILWTVWIICETLILLIQSIRKKRDELILYHATINIFFLVLSILEIWLDTAVQPISRGGYISFCFLFSTIFLNTASSIVKKNHGMYLIFFILGFILIYCFFSDNRNVFFGFDAAGTLVLFSWGYLLSKHINPQNRNILLHIGLCLPCIVGLLCFYGYVYRDLPLTHLDRTVHSGIFKGLITTENNSQYVEQLEKELQENIPKGTSVCTVNNIPAIYLMTRSAICSPQAWDSQFLNRGYTSAEPLLLYFEAKDQQPDYFIANDYLYSELYNRDDIELWDYIDEYYEEGPTIVGIDNSRTKIWHKR